MNLDKDYKGKRIALALAWRTLREFDTSLPLLQDGSNIMGLLLSGALDDPAGKGGTLHNPTSVHEALQTLDQALDITPSKAEPLPLATPEQLTIPGNSLYSTT